ncbi:MAG: class I SAM-dependent methyltransferase [Pseudonocardiaceae bacterium]|nr:MAG: class I SAM-dependent methyltransferase [Pseudonocardiaceae bacterium]
MKPGLVARPVDASGATRTSGGPGYRRGVADDRATSFGSIAAEYDRLRPSPSPEAIAWVVPPGCAVAVDLGAGTGLFTRALAAAVPDVVAVEPDARMREVLVDRAPGIRALEGTGEAIPLPDASADLVTVSSAWHWLDHERALPEIARVLRPGGRLAVARTGRDRYVEWTREVQRLRRSVDRNRRERTHDVVLPEGSPFGPLEYAEFTTVQRMSVDDVLASLGTYSGAITASDDDRAAWLTGAREVLERYFPGAAEIDVPMRSETSRTDLRR